MTTEEIVSSAKVIADLNSQRSTLERLLSRLRDDYRPLKDFAFCMADGFPIGLDDLKAILHASITDGLQSRMDQIVGRIRKIAAEMSGPLPPNNSGFPESLPTDDERDKSDLKGSGFGAANEEVVTR